MKLYAKNLRNIEELEQEKRLLLLEKKQLEEEDIFSIEGILSAIGEGSAKSGVGAVISKIAPSVLPLAGPAMGMLVDIVRNRFTGKKDERENGHSHAPSTNGIPEKKGKNILKSVATEFIGSYLKWKALELSYKGITLIVKKQKKKKAERAAQAEPTNKV